MKNTMNKRDVVRFHKFLDTDMKIGECAKAMKIELDTLKKFTPEKVAQSADRKAKIAAKNAARRAGNTTAQEVEPEPAIATAKPA